MRIAVDGSIDGLALATSDLLGRMLCPLTGMTQTIGFAMRGRFDPRVTVAGGEMTGVHVLRGGHPPRPGAYHIGGSGITYDESVIRTLGETLERYSHFAALATDRVTVVYETYDQMLSVGRRPIVPRDFRLYSDEQLARKGFPFSSFPREAIIGWVPTRSLVDGTEWWVPAQQAIVGYIRRRDEPQFTAGVTTGSAAHTVLASALRNALLELIQLDAAVGYWYGAKNAIRLETGPRTAAVEQTMRRRLHPYGPTATFFWMPSADLPGIPIACVIKGRQIPNVAVGLGCDLRLERAMYKAFLEGLAVAQLAKIVLFREAIEEPTAPVATDDPPRFYDLDANVGHYARQDAGVVEGILADSTSASPSDLPADAGGSTTDDVRLLVDGFRNAGKEVVALDLTTVDVADLGFRAVRTWSPDLLSLPLPSAAPLMHPRMEAYGGAFNDLPHPFP